MKKTSIGRNLSTPLAMLKAKKNITKGGTPEAPNLLPNGSFATNTNGWIPYVNGGTNTPPTVTWENGKARVDLLGTYANSGLVEQNPIQLVEGAIYTLKWKARGASNSTMNIYVETPDNQSSGNIFNLTTTEQTFTWSFKSNYNTGAKIYFRTQNPVSTNATIWFDDLELRLINLVEPRDSMAICNITRYKNFSNAQLDQVADLLLEAESEWVSVHHSPNKPSRLPYVQNCISRMKAKGLKVHLRVHHTTDRHELNFSSGSGAVWTATTLTDMTKSWVANEWKGYQVYTQKPNGADQQACYITSNTATQLTFIATPSFSLPNTAVIDMTNIYDISYQKFNDRAWDNTSRGYYYDCLQTALMGRTMNVESFSVANEITNSIEQASGSMMNSNSTIVSNEKALITYIKNNIPSQFPKGITASDGFWLVDEWLGSGLGSADFLAYTSYEEESRALFTAQRAVQQFGAGNVQLDEMSLSGTYEQTINSTVASNATEYIKLLNTRSKYWKNLGLRNVYRFELTDDGNGGADGWGYLAPMNNANVVTAKRQWFDDSYKPNIKPTINNWSVGFRSGKLAMLTPAQGVANMNLTNSFTMECWVNIALMNRDMTLFRREGSYILRWENGRLNTHTWTNLVANANIGESSPWTGNTLLDRWVHVAYVYDGSEHRIYTNGIKTAFGTLTGNIDNTNFPLAIGGEENGAGQPIDGRIQNVLITKDVLYTANFTANKILPTANANTVVRYALTEGTGVSVADSSGKNNNATLNGNANEAGKWFIGMNDTFEFQ